MAARRHVPTGKLRYRFLHCHGDKRITALAFDAAKRRLITGAEDGDCKVSCNVRTLKAGQASSRSTAGHMRWGTCQELHTCQNLRTDAAVPFC